RLRSWSGRLSNAGWVHTDAHLLSRPTRDEAKFALNIRRKWCCERGLNSRPLPYQGSALPLSYRSNLLSAADFCHIITQIASKQLHFFSHNVEICRTRI